jgi:hypothetical protein
MLCGPSLKHEDLPLMATVNQEAQEQDAIAMRISADGSNGASLARPAHSHNLSRGTPSSVIMLHAGLARPPSRLTALILLTAV